MPKVDIYNQDGQQVGELELSDAVWATPLHEHAIYETVRMQLANRRQGTASTKGRGEVRGGGRKPWRQKGTGRARHGSIRSPLWIGGGVTFGPKPRDYGYKVPKKVKRLALRSALSAKLNQGELVVLDQFSFEEPKTKRMLEVLAKLNASQKPLVILHEEDPNVEKSLRNIPGALTLKSDKINVYDLLNQGSLVITQEAIQHLEEVLT